MLIFWCKKNLFRKSPASQKPLACLFVLLVGFSACTFFKKTVGLVPTKPKVELESIGVKNLTWEKVQLLVGLKLQNPNSFSLDLSNLDYSVTYQEQIVAEGKYPKPFKLESDDLSRIQLPISLHAAKIMELLSKNAASATEGFMIFKIKLDFDTIVGPMEYVFQEKKSLGEVVSSLGR